MTRRSTKLLLGAVVVAGAFVVVASSLASVSYPLAGLPTRHVCTPAAGRTTFTASNDFFDAGDEPWLLEYAAPDRLVNVRSVRTLVTGPLGERWTASDPNGGIEFNPELDVVIRITVTAADPDRDVEVDGIRVKYVRQLAGGSEQVEGTIPSHFTFSRGDCSG